MNYRLSGMHHANVVDLTEETEASREPGLLGAWLTIQQAELMLGHLGAAGAEWPDGAIYLNSCITAMRSVTLTMQKALAHQPGFRDWYSGVQDKLGRDTEMRYLLEARNYVLKQGALRLKHSLGFRYDGELGISVHGFDTDGPDVRIHNPDTPDDPVPVDWRKLKGFEYLVDLRFAPVDGLPEPPDREVKELLREKLAVLRLIVLDAEERFAPEDFDPKEAAGQRKQLAPFISSES